MITYPFAVMDYLRIALDGGIFSKLAELLFGYWLARVGFIEIIEERVSIKFVAILWALFIALYVVWYYFKVKWISGLKLCINLSVSFAYASTLFYLYYHSSLLKKMFSLFEPYGKLGLTNYSMCGILGVCMMNDFGLGLRHQCLVFVLLIFIAFFLFQALFSWLWLKRFRYGPIEYFWRVGTERKWISNRIIN